MANEDRATLTLFDLVQVHLQDWPRPAIQGQEVVVPTHCLFGSGSVVRVIVTGGSEEAIVHDGAAAIDEFSTSGGDMPNAVRLVRAFLKNGGFRVSDDGVISAPPVPMSDLAPTIALVANAAKEAADHLLGRWRPVIRRDFKAALRKLLEAEFPHIKHEVKFEGFSTKQHRFDFVLPARQGGDLLIDAVAHEQSAISASVLKNLDIRNRHTHGLEQRVIYDDAQEWRAEDLNLLKLGATPVPFSTARAVIERLAA